MLPADRRDGANPNGVITMKKLLKATACAVAILIGCASAQPPTYGPRPNACGDGCTTIFLTGEIKQNDWKTFAGIVKNEHVTKTTVVMASPGGELYQRIAHGPFDTRPGFATVVPEKMECASGCALMWLAGHPAHGDHQGCYWFPRALYRAEVSNGRGGWPCVPDPGRSKHGQEVLDKLGVSKPAQSFLVSALRRTTCTG